MAMRDKKSKVAIIPVPYEKTTSYGKGAAKGPAAILDAYGHVEDYEIEEGRVTGKIGISALPAVKNIKNPQELFARIKKITDKVLKDGKIPVYLGGEHTITAAIISAIKTTQPLRAGAGFSVLHMDAHSDMRDTYDGNKYSHACVMRRVYEMGVPIVSVGIRSQCFAEQQFIEKKGIKIFYSHNVLGRPLAHSVKVST